MRLHSCPAQPGRALPPPRHLVSRAAAGRQANVIRVRASGAPAAATGELPQSLQSIVGSFAAVPDPMQRYKQLLFFASKLDPLPASDRVPANKVEGCVSQVWVVPTLGADGRVAWRADSDSQLTKGLAALLVQGLSGCTPEEIVSIAPDFIAALGLQQSLTPSRNNGFLNMFRLMQKKALALLVEAQGGGGGGEASSSGSGGGGGDAGPAEPAAPGGGGGGAAASRTPVADAIRAKLEAGLAPESLSIVDDSRKHAGHAGFRGSADYSGESHFSVAVVSAAFAGLTSLKRHRLVYGLLAEEMAGQVHALALVTKAPGEP